MKQLYKQLETGSTMHGAPVDLIIPLGFALILQVLCMAVKICPFIWR